jgi:hypothetical protein
VENGDNRLCGDGCHRRGCQCLVSNVRDEETML